MISQNGQVGDQYGLIQRIRSSIFPGTMRTSGERQSTRRFFNSLILHFRPRMVPERTLALSLTWGLGGMALVLVFLLFGTGLLLKFVYQPFPEKAYESVLALQHAVAFGPLIRNIHHWAANALIIIAFLHLLRVFFTGAFHPPRQFNWIIGLSLFGLFLLSNLTGYLLPWDQLAFWAITICTGMLEYIPRVGEGLQRLVQGGSEVGPATLSIFYALHTAVLPALLLLLMPFHFWRVRKAGGLVIPQKPEKPPDTRDESVPAIPNLILREVVVALLLLAGVLLFSVVVDAPLGDKANPGLSPNPTKAPWYFAGIQEILMHIHPLFALFIIPALMTIFLTALPYVNYQTNPTGIWFVSSKGRRMALVATITAAALTPIGILLDEYVMDLAGWMPGLSPIISNGLIPFVLIATGIAGVYMVMKRRYDANKNEALQTLFVFLLVVFLLLTVTGVWFRGEGMRLVYWSD